MIDDVFVLHATVPLEFYEHLRVSAQRSHFEIIAKVVTEIGPYISYVGVDLDLSETSVDTKAIQHENNGLKNKNINKLVYEYIGVSGGYLADFTYRTHREFYANLELDINPDMMAGRTTKERFIEILKTNSPSVQAKILSGILERYPIGSSESRTQERYDEIQGWIKELQTNGTINIPAPKTVSGIVSRAVEDAAQLIASRGASSGVDRMHTALHGYIKSICLEAGLEINRDAGVTELFKALREGHPAFSNFGPRSDDILKILRALATVIDALNPIRNRATIVHPNDDILDEPEAILVINSIRTLLVYLDAKIAEQI